MDLLREQAMRPENGAAGAALVGPIARASGSDYDVRKYFPYLGYETYDFDVPTATEGDVYARYRVRVAEMRQSVPLSTVSGTPSFLAFAARSFGSVK